MAVPDPSRQRRLGLIREGLIGLGFALLLAAAWVTVAQPALSEDPEAESHDTDTATAAKPSADTDAGVAR